MVAFIQVLWPIKNKILNQLIKIIIIFLFIPTLNFGQEKGFDYEPTKIRKEIRKIAIKIGKFNEIHSEAIGVGGERTKQYDRFEKLVEKATIDELIELTEHPKPAVRGYAFWGLAKKYYDNLEEIFVSHANDEEEVFQMQGCFGGEIAVIEFMRMVVMPQMLDMDCKKLNDAAFSRVKAKRKILNK